jgi:DNA-binding HxlR family transcriptional regulator
MRYKHPLELKKAILKALSEGKENTYSKLEKKLGVNWRTLRNNCDELEAFKFIEVKQKESHASNKKPYSEIKITTNGLKVLKTL